MGLKWTHQWNVFIFSITATLARSAGGLCDEDRPNGKRCPGFLDEQDETYCCASTVQPGSHFCCDWARKQKDLHPASDVQLPLLIGVVVGGSVVLLSLVLVLCLCCPSCPLHRWKRKRRDASRERDAAYLALSTHCPDPKPAAYEAPPPYPFAQEYPPHPPSWNWVAENATNEATAALPKSASS